MIEPSAQELTARLIAHRWLPRSESQVTRLLTDEFFRSDVLSRLDGCGLQLLENPFSEYVAIGLAEQTTEAVMEQDTYYLSNTFGLPRDAIALLVILWGLLVIPKRQRQYAAGIEEDAQTSFFPSPRLIIHEEIDKTAVKFSALISDFGEKLGRKSRMKMNLQVLKRQGFIVDRQGLLTEGPLLDLAINYHFMASRIIDGTLGELLQDPEHQSPAELAEQEDADV